MHNAAVPFTLGSALKVIPRHSKTPRSAFLIRGPAVMGDAAGVTGLAAKTTEDKQKKKSPLLHLTFVSQSYRCLYAGGEKTVRLSCQHALFHWCAMCSKSLCGYIAFCHRNAWNVDERQITALISSEAEFKAVIIHVHCHWHLLWVIICTVARNAK